MGIEQNPSFTIVTPSFNQGPFIAKSIQSVKDEAVQTSIEHIVLDNVSADSTRETLQGYLADPGRVTLRLIVEKDNGQTAAINKGFALSQGNYVSWLNTDEYLHPGALRTVEQAFLDNPDVDIIFGDCRFITPDGRTLGYRRSGDFSEDMLLYYGCYLPSCSTFIRRRVIDTGNFLDEYYRVTMDYEYYVRLSRRGYKFKHLSRVISDFTWHGSNISVVHNERRLVERRRVKDTYSQLHIPAAMRSVVYTAMELYWKARRFVWRARNRLGP